MSFLRKNKDPAFADDIDKQIQKWLNTYAFCNLKVDGIIGPETKKGLIRSLQHFLNCEHSAWLNLDGVFGADTKTACSKITIRPKAIGNSVCVLQGLLYANGLNPNGFSGEYTQDVANAIKYAQEQCGSTILDGVCYPNILIALAEFRFVKES